MWANGNGGRRDDDCAADGFASSIYTISVGAISVHGNYSPFDEPCSAKMTTAYVTDYAGRSRVVNQHNLNVTKVNCSLISYTFLAILLIKKTTVDKKFFSLILI